MTPTSPFPTPPKDNLQELHSGGAFRPLVTGITERKGWRFRTPERRALAVRLGYCLMDFLDGTFGSERIYARRSATADQGWSFNPAIYMLFTSSPPTSIDIKPFWTGNHPSFLSFTKFLLEMELGWPIDVHISSDHTSEANDEAFLKLRRIAGRLRVYQNNSYSKAIEGCLEVPFEIWSALGSSFVKDEDRELAIQEHVLQGSSVARECLRRIPSQASA
ncbi:hypothetical protein C8A05DRAFT_11784 [Staphylotrichum tortipilum]|uniref:DUF7580 domain-containing protein n=1 Tax=Staphylotrichum tortipilum TaxID=2831512 RepID=A0AAN6MUD9_9PEZI|nr:hypothetical protein C8A05DRAFT_11784 [Staphylotrichum longicolle]